MNCLLICLAMAHNGVEHSSSSAALVHEHLGHLIIFGGGFAFLIGYLIRDTYRKRQLSKLEKEQK